MLYVVGGASRSGKTLLARRLLEEEKVPWFSLDALRVGLTKGLPTSHFDLDRDDLEEARHLWPIVSEMLDSLLFYDVPYLVEGSCLRPPDVAELMSRRRDKEIRAVFLGFPGMTPEQKLADVANNRVGGNDWLTPLPDAETVIHVERGIRDSQTLRQQAAESQLPFIDTGADFAISLDRAIALLRKSNRQEQYPKAT